MTQTWRCMLSREVRVIRVPHTKCGDQGLCVEAICLNLTCRALWQILKELYMIEQEAQFRLFNENCTFLNGDVNV